MGRSYLLTVSGSLQAEPGLPCESGTLGFDSCFCLDQAIRVSTRTGVPLDVLPARGLTAKQAERMSRINDLDLPRVSTQPRDKQESREERRARKQAIKEERKVRSRVGESSSFSSHRSVGRHDQV